jgi:hypothetical protein
MPSSSTVATGAAGTTPTIVMEECGAAFPLFCFFRNLYSSMETFFGDPLAWEEQQTILSKKKSVKKFKK